MKRTYKKFSFEAELSDEQITFFNQHGFVHFEAFTTLEQVTEILRSLYEVQEKLINENVLKIRGIPVKYGRDEKGSQMIHRIPFTSVLCEPVQRFLADPRIAQLKKLLPDGGRIAENEKDGVITNHYVNTKNSKFRKMGWHTDSVRDIFYGKPIQPMLNVGLYLDDSPEDKGGLRLLPGTHKQNVFGVLFRKFYFFNHRTDKKEEMVIAKAGDLVIHDGRIWHRVAMASLKGEASRRRVIYFPIISGHYQPKSEDSPTPLYHRLLNRVG